METAINIGIYIAYLLLGLTIIGAVVFPIIQMAGDIKKAKGALIGVLAFVIVFLISYALSTPETGAFYDKFGITPTNAKVIGGALIATYIFFAGVIISVIYSQIVKWIQ